MSGKHALGNWHTNPPKGYPRFHSGQHRGKYVHIVIFEKLSHRFVKPGFTIHHQNFNRMCFCSHNLIEVPEAFNLRSEIRDPYTGQFLNRSEYERRYGK